MARRSEGGPPLDPNWQMAYWDFSPIAAVPYTFSAWIKIHTDDANGTAFSIGDSGSETNYSRLSLQTQLAPPPTIFDHGIAEVRHRHTASTAMAVSAAESIIVGTWYHIVGVERDIADARRLYINGVLQDDNGDDRFGAISFNRTALFAVARDWATTPALTQWSGSVEMTRAALFSRELLQSEITALAAGEWAEDVLSCVFHVPMIEGDLDLTDRISNIAPSITATPPTDVTDPPGLALAGTPQSLRASPLVAADDAIVSVNDLWEPSVLFLPNWEQAVSLGSSYRTVIQSSRSNSEQRLILAEKPRRTMGYSLRSYTTQDTERLRAFLARSSRARIPMPLFTDPTILTGKPDINTNQYNGDFTNRRFQVGARAVAIREGAEKIIEPGSVGIQTDPGISTEFQYRIITALSDTQITLDGDLNEDYSTPAHVGVHEMIAANFIDPSLTFSSFKIIPIFPGDLLQASYSFFDDNIRSVVKVELLDSQTLEVVEDVTSSMYYEFSTQRADVAPPPAGGYINSGGLVVKPAATGNYLLKWTMNDLISQVTSSFTTVRGAHSFQAIASTESNETAVVSPTFSEVRVTDTVDRDFQLAISEHYACSETAGEFLASPPSLPVNSTFLTRVNIASIQQGAAVQWVADSTGSRIFEATLGSSHGDGFFGSHAAVVIYNPVESNGYDRSTIYPVIECDMELGNRAEIVTDKVNQAKIIFVETPGLASLAGEETPGDLPTITGLDTHNGIPIMTLPLSWDGLETGTFRTGKRERAGITTTIQVFGSKPGTTFKLPFFASTRAEIFDILRWFDSRGGRGFPFYLPSPSPEFEILELLGGPVDTVRVAANISLEDWNNITEVSFLDKTTGFHSVHEVTFVAQPGDDFIHVTFSESLLSNDITRYEMRLAHLVRFNTDGLDEDWITDKVNRVVLDCRELVNELVVPVTLVDLCGAGGGDTWEPPVDGCDPCATSRCGTDSALGCCMCGLEGASIQIDCWGGRCFNPPDSCNQTECRKFGSCATFLPFKSCIAGVIRYENPNVGGGIWAELDTISVLWTWSLGSWPTDCDCNNPGVDHGEGGCPCLETTCEDGEIIDSHSCSGFVRTADCFEFDGCVPFSAITISTAGGDVGNADCEDVTPP